MKHTPSDNHSCQASHVHRNRSPIADTISIYGVLPKWPDHYPRPPARTPDGSIPYLTITSCPPAICSARGPVILRRTLVVLSLLSPLLSFVIHGLLPLDPKIRRTQSQPVSPLAGRKARKPGHMSEIPPSCFSKADSSLEAWSNPADTHASDRDGMADRQRSSHACWRMTVG